MTIAQHCKAYIESLKRLEAIREHIARAQREHDAGDEDTNAWRTTDEDLYRRPNERPPESELR